MATPPATMRPRAELAMFAAPPVKGRVEVGLAPVGAAAPVPVG